MKNFVRENRRRVWPGPQMALGCLMFTRDNKHRQHLKIHVCASSLQRKWRYIISTKTLYWTKLKAAHRTKGAWIRYGCLVNFELSVTLQISVSLLCVNIYFVSQGAAKTPVSVLQELYVKKGINPKYDLIQIEGAIHEPTFKYRVSVGELVGKCLSLIFTDIQFYSDRIFSSHGFWTVQKEGQTCCS